MDYYNARRNGISREESDLGTCQITQGNESKWVYKKKEDSIFKVRLVVKGYSQIPNIDFTNVFSPIVKHRSIRTLLSMVAMHDLELQQLDLNTVFLHGNLEENIYMDQSKGFAIPGKEDLVCRLKKSLYGLKESPRQWYKKFDNFMMSQNFKR